MSERKKTPQERWQAENMIRVSVPIARKTEADILEQLEKQSNKSGYIKALIRADIEKGERK